MSTDRPNYYGILPARVRYDERLSASAKILYTEITALTQKTGECCASNRYFADLYGVKITTVSEWIRQLAEADHIQLSISDGTHRYMILTEANMVPFGKNGRGASGKTEAYPSGKAEHNNTSSNTTRRILSSEPPNGASEPSSEGTGKTTTGNGDGKHPHPFAAHAEAFAKAFKERFGDDYQPTAGDFVQGVKFIKARPTATPEHLVKLATYHWGRGDFTPKASLTLRGICTQWTTLRAQYQKQKPSEVEAPEMDAFTKERYG